MPKINESAEKRAFEYMAPKFRICRFVSALEQPGIASQVAAQYSLSMAFDAIPWVHWLPHPRFPEDAASYQRRWSALIAVSLGVFLIALDITIVGVTAPTLSKGLGATATQIQWAFDAFTVVLGGFVVLGGGLAERYGRKGCLQAGILVFAMGATISAYAPTPGVLIAGRVVSGLGQRLHSRPACRSSARSSRPRRDIARSASSPPCRPQGSPAAPWWAVF